MYVYIYIHIYIHIYIYIHAYIYIYIYKYLYADVPHWRALLPDLALETAVSLRRPVQLLGTQSSQSWAKWLPHKWAFYSLYRKLVTDTSCTSIGGWFIRLFIMEHVVENGWFGGTHISGNLQIVVETNEKKKRSDLLCFQKLLWFIILRNLWDIIISSSESNMAMPICSMVLVY